MKLLGPSLLWFVPPILALIVFARLVAIPSSLIADAERPSVDREVPESARSPGNDLTRLFLPHHARIAAEVARTGRVPGWDPAGFGGRPLVGNPQAGLWYPPTWPVWRFWSPSALGWMTVAHLVVGGWGVMALGRKLRLSPIGAAVAGGLWVTSPYLLAQIYEGHYPHVWAASLAPWVILAALAWRAGAWGSVVALPALLALAALTGHPQEAYLLVVALGIWLLIATFRRWIRYGRGQRRRLDVLLAAMPPARSASVLLIVALTAGLVAIEVIPDALARPFTVRPFRPSPADAGKYHVGLANLAQVFCPFALGGPSDYSGPSNYWESLLSLGAAPAFLAAWGIARSRRRRAVMGLSTLAAGSILFAFGRGSGVFDLLYKITPGMALFRVPSRALFLATMATSLLAGLGVDALADSRTFRARERRRGLVAMVAIPLCLAGGVLGAGAARRVCADPRFLLALAGCLVGWSCWRLIPHRRRPIAAALGALALMEMALYGFALIRVSPPDRFLGPDPVGRAILAHRPEGPFRIRARDAFYGDARAFALGLEKTNLNDSFQIRHAADLYERLYPMFGEPIPTRFPRRFHPEVQREVLDRMNVALLVTDRDDDRIGWPVVDRGRWGDRPFVLRANPDPLPRAYVVPSIAVLADGPAVVDDFPDYPAREFVVLSRDVLPLMAARQPFTPAEYVERGPDRVEIRVTTENPGLLIVADTWMPGWEATTDGNPTAIFRGNRAQRVVVLATPGRHTIVMQFTPPGLALGRGVTVATLAVWAILALIVGGLAARLRRESR